MSRKDIPQRQTTDIAAADDSRTPILHVDMDAFFAAVELRTRPELRGRPMMVAGVGGRGVVLSATYEARAFGVRSAMPTATARALCPQIVIIEPRHNAYRKASQAVMSMVGSISACVEQVSIDEAFLDVSGARRVSGRPLDIAYQIRRRVADELNLTATVGIAANKFLAKLASTMAKPDGVLIISPHQVADILRPLPVQSLWGVGQATATRLTSLGLATVGEVADANPTMLRRALGGAAAESLQRLARGIDERVVTPHTPEISIGTEHTFDVDVADSAALQRKFLDLASSTGRRLRRAGQRATTIAIKVRFADFRTVTRSLTLPAPTSNDREIYAAAWRCWQRLDHAELPVRLLGVRAENFTTESAQQLTLDAHDNDWEHAQQALDDITDRFGAASLRPATLLPAPPSRERRPGR